MAASKNELKIVVVGDGTVGKTCLLSVFGSDEFAFEHIPTIFENKQHSYKHANGQVWNLDLWDTAGQENFDRLRPLSYKEVNCFLVCFSVADEDTLDNIKYKWMPELQNHASGNEKFILVGTKCDMRANKATDCISEETINQFVNKHNTKDQNHKYFKYCETSALKRTNFDDPFKSAIEACMQQDAVEAKSCCTIL